MAKEVTMPKLAMTQETGTILQWYKTEGDAVAVGEPILEVMTNKINIDVESYEDGVLLKRLYETGAEIPVLQVIAYIGQPEEEVPSGASTQRDSTNSTQPSAEAQQASILEDRGVTPSPMLRATPAARAIARKHDVNLSQVVGSGNHGRIHKDDVQAFVDSRQVQTASTPSDRRAEQADQVKGLKPVTHANAEPNNELSLAPGDKRVPLSGMRKVIGQRMSQSAYQAPHVTLTLEVNMEKISELKSRLSDVIEKENGTRLSLNVFIMKATSTVLRKFPNVNATWNGDNELIYHRSVHLGMAVSVPNGLFVPVLPSAHEKGLAELAAELKQIAVEARDGKLGPEAFEGGTFTVSNLGMFAIEGFTPIINTPQVAILGVGAVIDKAVVVDKEVKVCPMMTLSLSFDHRALDGAEAASFLKQLKQVLEEPIYLLT